MRKSNKISGKFWKKFTSASALAAVLAVSAAPAAFAAGDTPPNQPSVSLDDINNAFSSHFQGKDEQGRVQASDGDGVQAEENYWNYMGASASRAVDNNFKDQKAWFKSLSPAEKQTVKEAVRSASSDLGIQTQPASLKDINNAFSSHFQGKDEQGRVQASDGDGVQAEENYWSYMGASASRAVDNNFKDQKAWFKSLSPAEQQTVRDAVKQAGVNSGLSTGLSDADIQKGKDWVNGQIKSAMAGQPPAPADGTDYDHKQDAKINSNTASITDLNNAVTDPSAKGNAQGQGKAWDQTARDGVASNGKAIQQNQTDIAKNRTDIDSNTGNIAENRGNIQKNRQDIDANTQGIADANVRINDNAGNISTLNQQFQQGMADGKAYVDQSSANTLRSANAYTDQRYNEMNSHIKKLRSRADTGVSGATAIGSLAFDTLKKNSFAGGLGVAKDKISGAVGYQRNFTEHWRARATLALGLGDNYVQGGTSVGYSW